MFDGRKGVCLSLIYVQIWTGASAAAYGSLLLNAFLLHMCSHVGYCDCACLWVPCTTSYL